MPSKIVFRRDRTGNTTGMAVRESSRWRPVPAEQPVELAAFRLRHFQPGGAAGGP
jgi:hypothetical protein